MVVVLMVRVVVIMERLGHRDGVVVLSEGVARRWIRAWRLELQNLAFRTCE
jgi:hypothetical protein